MTPSTTSPRRGRPANASTDDTVATVLTAARRQFAAHGYAGTSNRSVAEAAGLAHTAIYNHFGSKARLFMAVFSDVQDRVLAELARSVDAAPDDPPFPRALLDAVDALRAADPSYVEFLASMYAEVRRHPELRELFGAGQPPPLFDTLRTFAAASPPGVVGTVAGVAGSSRHMTDWAAGSAPGPIGGSRAAASPDLIALAPDDDEATTWFWVTFALGLAQLSAVATPGTFAAAVSQLRRQLATPATLAGEGAADTKAPEDLAPHGRTRARPAAHAEGSGS